MAVYAVPKTNVSRLSYSAASSYSECGEKFRLSRVFGLDNQTWWVTLMGTAVHYITEQRDLADAGFPTLSDETTPEDFPAVFQREIDKAEKFNQEIKASGRVLKNLGSTGGPNKKDREWCEHYGPEFIQAWIDWRNSKNYRVAFMPGGKPGVEYEVKDTLAGVPFVGFIDRVFETHDGNLVVVDLKTGNAPGSNVQLQSYAALLRLQGVDVSAGAYWLASNGDVKEWVDTPASADAGVAHLVGQVVKGLEAGVFVPHVSALCKGCGVRDFCTAVDGKDAGLVGEPEPLTVGLPPAGKDGELL